MATLDGEHGVTAAALPERLLASTLAVGAVAVPYLLRGLDDNRLTSWSWVFGARDPAVLFALVMAAAAAAHAVAAALPARRAEAVLFLCAFGAGAAFWSEPEPIVDAARYFTQAKHLELYGPVRFLREWGREVPAWTDLPLVPFLYGIALRLSGESRLALQAFTTLLFAGTAVLTCRIGKMLWDEETGFAAGAFLLAMPYLLAQVPLALVDVPTAFFLALATYASLRALERGGAAGVLLAGLTVFLALASKYSAWLLLSVLPVAAVVPGVASRRRRLAVAAKILLVAAALAALAALPRREVYARQLALLLGYQAPGLRRWGESFLSTFVFQVHPFVTAAAIASAWLAARRRDARWVIAAWPVLLLVTLGVRRARYLLPAFPMLGLMAAYGLQAIRAAGTRRAVLACAVLSSLAVGLYGYLPFLKGTSAMNLRRAGEYLDGLPENRVEVMTAFRPDAEVNPAVSVPILDLFTAKPLAYRDEGIPRPSGRRAEESTLRFTWELGVAAWYAQPAETGTAAVAVVTDGVAPFPPRVSARLQDLVLDRTFDADDGVFEHVTQVRVYRLRSVPSPAATPGSG
ncbi:MAG TPA: glycosyltransferase family 39 protein [Anaeromyxobacter sp.]